MSELNKKLYEAIDKQIFGQKFFTEQSLRFAVSACEKIVLQEFQDFCFEMAEDYHLWDDEMEPYPAERIFDAMKNKIKQMENSLQNN